MYSSHNEEKSVIAQQFIRTLKNKIYKRIISISTNMYVGKLDDIVNKGNNTYQSTVKMKPADVKLNSYIKSSKEINDKDPKFKIGNTVWISKYRKKNCERLFPNWSEEEFVIKKVKNTLLLTYVISDRNREKNVRKFYIKELQKTNEKELKWVNIYQNQNLQEGEWKLN